MSTIRNYNIGIALATLHAIEQSVLADPETSEHLMVGRRRGTPAVELSALVQGRIANAVRIYAAVMLASIPHGGAP